MNFFALICLIVDHFGLLTSFGETINKGSFKRHILLFNKIKINRSEQASNIYNLLKTNNCVG